MSRIIIQLGFGSITDGNGIFQNWHQFKEGYRVSMWRLLQNSLGSEQNFWGGRDERWGGGGDDGPALGSEFRLQQPKRRWVRPSHQAKNQMSCVQHMPQHAFVSVNHPLAFPCKSTCLESLLSPSPCHSFFFSSLVSPLPPHPSLLQR